MLVVHYLLAFASFLSLVFASDRAAQHRRMISQTRITQFLDAHNGIRAVHGAADLTWSYALAAQAQVWTSACNWRATLGTLLPDPYGENMVAATGFMSIPDAVNAFASDKDEYTPGTPVLNHFTQVVWKNTTELGCAIARCDNIFKQSATFVTCLYSPAGNIIGQALDNVQI